MKTIINLIAAAVLSAVLLMITSSTVKGQDCTCVEETELPDEGAYFLDFIHEEDYPNFMHISGLKRYYNIVYDESAQTPTLRSYQIQGSSKGGNLMATYDKDGKLIRAKYVTKNTRLPKHITEHLVMDEYKDWTMVSNKVTVRNFDPESTEYQVKMKNGKQTQTLHFDRSGNRIDKLARKNRRVA